jgi:DNA-binding transcriptional ArsR family regulator
MYTEEDDMAVSKKELFEDRLREIAEQAKALAHPARLAILKALAAESTCICGEIVEQVPLAQSTVSQHLKELKRVGFIKGEVDGPRSCYCLDSAKLQRFQHQMNRWFDDLQEVARRACCGKDSS